LKENVGGSEVTEKARVFQVSGMSDLKAVLTKPKKVQVGEGLRRFLSCK